MTPDQQDSDFSEDLIGINDSPSLHLWIVNDAQRQYVESNLDYKSSTEKSIGRRSDEFIAFGAALEKISMGIAEEGNEKEDKHNIDDDNSHPTFTDSEFLTKIQIRTISSQIKDLNNKWDDLNIDGPDPEKIINDADLEESIWRVDYAFDIDYSVSKVDQDELESRMEDVIEMGIFEEYANQVYRRKLAKLVLPYYILYQTYVDELSVQRLNDNIVMDHYKGTNGIYELFDNMAQPTREKLLERTGSLEPHYVSNMVENRRFRNSLVHSYYGRNDFDIIDEASDEIERCIDLLSKLDDSRFSWNG